ncbi:MAG: hypothetical protein ACYDHN_07875 [Solirubrobacteraceae bacterium]
MVWRPTGLTFTALLAVAAFCTPVVAWASSAADARSATRSERAAILSVYAREDGSASQVRSVYVSRANASLAVACARTPEAGTFAYVFARSHGHWRYATSGRPGRVGNAAERRLELACG